MGLTLGLGLGLGLGLEPRTHLRHAEAVVVEAVEAEEHLVSSAIVRNSHSKYSLG